MNALSPEIFLDGKVTQYCGDVRAVLAQLPDDHFDCVVTSPPYWGLRDYGVAGQLGLEPSLGEHLAVMVDVFREVRRVLKPSGTAWLNYGDCYATSPNGRSAADTKAAGNDDRTFRDKPFSTVGAIYRPDVKARSRASGKEGAWHGGAATAPGRIQAGGFLKPKDLCMVPNRLAIALQDDGWWVRSEIIWGKTNPMPDSSGRYRPSTAHEKIFLLTKSSKSFYDAEAVMRPFAAASIERLAQDVESQTGSDRANGGTKTNGNMKAVRFGGTKGQGDFGSAARPASGREWEPKEGRLLRNYEPADLEVWPMAPQPFSEAHFATFPQELAERCIKAGCPANGLVLDPFGGAGTTGLVAASLGRASTLIELNPDYCRLARARIESAFMGAGEGAQHLVRSLGKTSPPGPLFETDPAMQVAAE